MAAASPGATQLKLGTSDELHPLCFGNFGPSARRGAGRDARLLSPAPPAAGQSRKSKFALFHPS